MEIIDQTEITDEQILKEFRNPESRQTAFNWLVQKYQVRIYWHVRRMVFHHEDANDLVQDIMIKVWRNLEKFRGDSKLYTYLYRIATNEVYTFLNKKKRKHFISLSDIDQNFYNVLKTDPYFNGDEIQIKLQKAISTLPRKQRLIFNMRYYDELSYAEISDIVNTSVGALKASYHHAAKKIEKFLKAD